MDHNSDDQKLSREYMRPKPITGRAPKTIEEANELGTTFAQDWVRWLESHLLSLESPIAVTIKLVGEIKERYEKMYCEFLELRLLFNSDMTQNRALKEQMIETMRKQGEALIAAQNESSTFMKNMRTEWTGFVKESNDRWWQYILGTFVSAASIIGLVAGILKLFGKL